MRFKNSFIMILFLLAALFGAAQDGPVIYEGTLLNYKVDFNEGNSYAWKVTNATNLAEFDFLGDPAFSEVGIKWNLAGTYDLQLTESHPSGCSTTRQLSVQVQPNNRTIGFDIVASTECFNTGTGNSFAMALNVLDNSGGALAAAYFPLQVEFTVNGINQLQLLEFDNQTLQVNETMFAANPAQNTVVEVAIAKVTDVKNAPIQAGAINGTHTRTIFAIPEIEFTEALRRRYNLLPNEITAYVETRRK